MYCFTILFLRFHKEAQKTTKRLGSGRTACETSNPTPHEPKQECEPLRLKRLATGFVSAYREHRLRYTFTYYLTHRRLNAVRH
jgi:hypothetical protein